MTYLYADRQVFECANVMCLDLELLSVERVRFVSTTCGSGWVALVFHHPPTPVPYPRALRDCPEHSHETRYSVLFTRQKDHY
jgi:hypothetical protein